MFNWKSRPPGSGQPGERMFIGGAFGPAIPAEPFFAAPQLKSPFASGTLRMAIAIGAVIGVLMYALR